MHVFLTGGSGFVGRHLVRTLLDDGHTVAALARSDTAAAAVAAAGATPIRGDLADLAPGPQGAASGPVPDWARHLRDVDAVVHGAARMEFWGPDKGFVRDNHQPSLALHRAAVDARVARFVLVSAASVSTGTRRGPRQVDESYLPAKPNIAYSRVKLMTEQALRSADPGQTSLVVLRPPFIWGAGMTTLDEMATAARSGRFMWVDHGRHIMDVVHVDNLAHATGSALNRGPHGGIYYVTDGSPRPNREFLTALLATRGVDVSTARSVPGPVAAGLGWTLDLGARLLRRRTPPPLTNWLVSVMSRDRQYDITAAREHLGYAPVRSFEADLAQMSDVGGSEPPRPPIASAGRP